MSLYLKYRPQNFDGLVGQDFIKNTLKNAVKTNHIVGAYLLCGPRGTGKTSTARILAKAINCINQKDGNPCLNCEICNDFFDEKLIDIIEIDAASHTGVDNIRDLIQKAQFKPTKTKFKVYIIDEVHMLSKGAFNALLKILEEPPEHVKFILATTETHKVPETIISRCQRYDFKKISYNDINDRLNFIAKSENIKIDNDSLDYIIKNSGGGLRNAISLFEQYIQDGEINFSKIEKNLGLVSISTINNFINLLINYDIGIVAEFDNLVEKGINLKLFFKEIIFIIKDKCISNLNNGTDLSNLIFILETLEDVIIKSKNSLDENITFLIGILKILNNQINQEHKNETIKNEIKIEKNISKNDIEDVFGNEITESVEVKEKKIESKNIEKLTNNFDLDKFISKLKELGAKGGLTMGIRGAKINLNGSNLEIIFGTKFALKTINTNENQVILNNAFELMGFNGGEVILK